MKKHLLSFACALALAQASAVDSAFSYQDYLDFGANRGRFLPGATGLKITSQDGSKSVILDAPMIDFSAANKGNFHPAEVTSIGENLLLSAAHMISPGTRENKLFVQNTPLEFGGVNLILLNSSRTFNDYYKGNAANPTIDPSKNDFVILRTHKISLSSAAIPIKLDFFHPGTFSLESGYQTGSETSAKNEIINNPNRYKYFVRSGTGVQQISSGDAAIKVADAGKYLTGGFTHIAPNPIVPFGIKFNDNSGPAGNKRAAFSSVLSQGDSGSALYVFDDHDKQWYLLGVASSTNCSINAASCSTSDYHLIDNEEIKAFKNQTSIQTNSDLSLDGDTLQDSTAARLASLHKIGDHYYSNLGTHTKANYISRLAKLKDDKDLIITGGSMKLSAASDLGSAALKIAPNLHYEITGDQEFIHGGLALDNGSYVQYHAKTPKYDHLHIAGNGSVDIYGISQGGLRVGNNAKVCLKDGAKFNDYYLNAHAQLSSFSGSSDKLFINNSSVQLSGDIEGNLQASKHSKITASTPVNVQINNSSALVFHGDLEGPISLNHKLSSEFLYDGNVKINSAKFSPTSDAQNPTVVLQGSAQLHNYVANASYRDNIRANGGGEVESSATNNKDIKSSEFEFKNLELANTELKILSDVQVKADTLTATNAKITIGADEVLLDKFDGDNFTYKADLYEGNSAYEEQSIAYRADITKASKNAQNISLNANINLTNSPLEAKNAKISGSIIADANSALSFNNVCFDGSITAAKMSAQNTSFILSQADSIKITQSSSGGDNKLILSSKFSADTDKILLASLANDSALSKEYFQVSSDLSDAFSQVVPNVQFEQDGNVYKWYLAKISDDSRPTEGSDTQQPPIAPNPAPSEPTPPVVPNPAEPAPQPPVEPAPTEPPVLKPEQPMPPAPSEPKEPAPGEKPIQPNNPTDKPTPTEPSEPTAPAQPQPPVEQPMPPVAPNPAPSEPTPPVEKPTPAEPTAPTEPTAPPPAEPTAPAPETPRPSQPPVMDYNPGNNPSNTETSGFYKDYFFVKENTQNIQQASSTLNQVFFAHVLEWNNLHKRMGELRLNNGAAGVWAKAMAGQSRYESPGKTNFYELQAGVDKHSDFNGGSNFSGAMITFSNMRPRSANINSGDIKGAGFGLYSSWIFDNGYYFDGIVKYSRFKNNFDINFTNANNTTSSLAAKNSAKNIIASAEFGRRISLNNGAYIEPSAEIISGHVGAQNISNEAAHLQLESKAFTPLSAKFALAIGEQPSDQSALGWRLQAAWAQDLAKNGDKIIRDLNVIRNIPGERDSRLMLSGAFSYQLERNATLNLEFERSYFGKMNTPYLINFTIRKEF